MNRGESEGVPSAFFVVTVNVDATDPVVGGHRDGAVLGALDLADAREDVGFGFGERLVGDLAQLQAHLRLEELLAQHGVVLHFLLRRGHDLVEDEPDAPDEKRIEDDHARSSFNLMFTKLYGGQGPVYLNVSLSNLPAIDFTLASNARSWSREI